MHLVASPLGESIFEPPGMLEVGVTAENVLDSSSVGLDDIPGAFRGEKIFLDDWGPLHDSKYPYDTGCKENTIQSFCIAVASDQQA